MSNLKNELKELHIKSHTLTYPWNYILQNIDHLNAIQILQLIVQKSQHLNIRGITINNKQCTFETIAQHIPEEQANVFFALYGLAITCVTGELHTYLKQYTRTDWVHLFIHIKIHKQPIFVYACQQNIQTLMQWMIEVMNDIRNFEPLIQQDIYGNTPLHYAVMRKQWKWTQRLVDKNCSPFVKNNKGKTPLMLTAPHQEHLEIFKKHNKQWFDALHEALVDGKEDAMWCYALINEGADCNQPELYNSPCDSLLIFARSGMDMNLPTDETFSIEQYRLMFLYGRKPIKWNNVLNAFSENEWVRMLHDISIGFDDVQMTQEYKDNLKSRRAIIDTTIKLQKFITNHD